MASEVGVVLWDSAFDTWDLRQTPGSVKIELNIFFRGSEGWVGTLHIWCQKCSILEWAWWLTPVIPALLEAETGGSRGHEVETTLVNMVKPCLY